MPATTDRPEAWPAPVGRGKTFEQFARPPGGPRTSGLAVASFVCGLLGFLCVTALASVALGLGALISIAGAPHLRKGKGLAIAGIVLSTLWAGSMVAAVLLSPGLRARLDPDATPPPTDIAPGPPAPGFPAPGFPAPGPTPPGPYPMMPGVPGFPAPGAPGTPVPGMPIPMTPLPPRAPSPFYSALNPAGGPLQSQIEVQIAGAESTGRRLVVFFTAEWCAPCRAVRQALAAPDLVARLSAVQLVEVDVDAFTNADLSRVASTMVGRRIDAIPLLCTLRSSLPPVCIDGAAWGEDTDANIRAVLVPFLASPPSGLTPNVPMNPVPI